MQTLWRHAPPPLCRTGAILILAALLLVVVFAFLAFTVDVGYMSFEKSRLQNAADFAALGAAVEIPQGEGAVILAAQQIAADNEAGGGPVVLAPTDVELGVFHFGTKEFVPGGTSANAVRVTARLQDQPFFFAPLMGYDHFQMSAQAIAMLNPRDIVFVVDTSGSMNDDTEPCWATTVINAEYGPLGYPHVGTALMQALFLDFGFGVFPGVTEHFGESLGAPLNEYAYAEMTKDDGLLSDLSIPNQYRILPADSEATRKYKAYCWMIDYQIAAIMPQAMPKPDSQTNYAYWEKYLDYLHESVRVGNAPPPSDSEGSGGSGGFSPSEPQPPLGQLRLHGPELFPESPLLLEPRQRLVSLGEYALLGATPSTGFVSTALIGQTLPGVPRRGSYDEVWLPESKDHDEVWDFNNPNRYSFPNASSSLPREWTWKIGYLTYVQFMMDWGRDRTPLGSTFQSASPGAVPKTPLSLASPYCPLHAEQTPGGVFLFPPREQPMHATRRALIAALQICKERNAMLGGQGDRVAIITFDAIGPHHAPQLVQPLTSDYDAAMQACTTLQAVSDIGASTAMEAGLLLAREHLAPPTQGGHGRRHANKVVILLTDGIPNVWVSSQSDINQYISENPSGDYYNSAYVWLNSALMQASLMHAEQTVLHTVGVGLGADYDFLDRLARRAGTDSGGTAPRGTGNPAEYEQVMTDIFLDIIRNPGSRLVE